MPFNLIANSRFGTAYEVAISQVHKFDIYCRENPDYKERTVDCITAEAYTIIAVLACLGTGRLKDATTYFRRMNSGIGPLYQQIRKQVLYDHSEAELSEIGKNCLDMFVKLGKQLQHTS